MPINAGRMALPSANKNQNQKPMGNDWYIGCHWIELDTLVANYKWYLLMKDWTQFSSQKFTFASWSLLDSSLLLLTSSVSQNHWAYTSDYTQGEKGPTKQACYTVWKTITFSSSKMWNSKGPRHFTANLWMGVWGASEVKRIRPYYVKPQPDPGPRIFFLNFNLTPILEKLICHWLNFTSVEME